MSENKESLPKVSIIVTTYKEENKRYLDLCIESIGHVDYPREKLEVIVVSKPAYQPQYHDVRTIHPGIESFNNEFGLNYALKQATGDFFLICNDDIILTKSCLRSMLSKAVNYKCIMNATSPCDNSVQYVLTFAFKTDQGYIGLGATSYKYEQLIEYKEALINATSMYPAGIVLQDYLCMYATLIPRIAYEEIGESDASWIKAGPSDLDYSWRAKEKGYVCLCALDAVIWHFGGVSAATTIDDKIRAINARKFFAKWGRHQPGITEEAILKWESTQSSLGTV